ncbi:MAG: hypothetical protein AB7O62_10820 [Pirellulales bacterium]
MFGNMLLNQFHAMGADVRLAVVGDRFQIGINQGRFGETFQVRLPNDGSVTAKVLDADRRGRHLLLDVSHRNFGANQKYLCGHDEFHWFVAALPETPDVGTVSEAMEALKPRAVRRAQERHGLKRKQRRKRRTRAYVRQGEWFFLPSPEFDPVNLVVAQRGKLVRGAGKPHHVQQLCRGRDGRTYVRGKVSHPDHATIRLEIWHLVSRNTEATPKDLADSRRSKARDRGLFDMTYLD